MPQLDKVTLLSQVFWLIILYFLFFLVVLKYYLPKFSKLFKIRFFYISSGEKVLQKQVALFSGVSSLFTGFKSFIAGKLASVVVYYTRSLKSYNLDFLEKVNTTYVLIYSYTCIKYKLYKKLYL